MTTSRRKLFNERAEIDARQERGDPILFDEIPASTRGKIALWVCEKLCTTSNQHQKVIANVRRALGTPSLAPDVPSNAAYITQIWTFATTTEPPNVWALIEAAIDAAVDAVLVTQTRNIDEVDEAIQHLNELLGDEFLGWRIVLEGKRDFCVRRVDSRILHREVVDRTYHLTAHDDFASANKDYSDAWKDFSRREYDNAITNAGKALESAEKIVLKKLAPQADTSLTAAPLAKAVFDAGILPPRLQTFRAQLRTIFEATIGPVRNMAGNAHGSEELNEPDAHLALLILNLTGSLIVFLLQTYEKR